MLFSSYLILCLDSDWIIVNRGLYVCDECCSIHRSLGRHISQIKSLNAEWCPVTLNVSGVFLFVLQNSNSIHFFYASAKYEN